MAASGRLPLEGLTVIAVGTSIPDCAASIIAVMKKQMDTNMAL